MRFLLTNDDGIYARGLSALYQELSKEADCIVVAPEVEQSAVGHAITISRPLMVRQARKNGQFMGWAVTGTPADCVKIGLRELSDKPVDLVVSGINLGANVGINVLYSGTVSAATEGAILGVPSIAISLGTHSRNADFGFAARFARKIARFMLEHSPNRRIPLNVNIPAVPEKDIKGIAVTRQGQARLMEQFEKRVDPRENVYYWLAGETQITDAEDNGTDFLALRNGMISITPIYYDMTRHDVLDELRGTIGKLAP
ncbi:MAG: 5'/3'-nucleotidase SurE [Pseudomonadota bacterium]|nr:5'/3'-nucleotidase SurE [Syntrophaceae bacterium]MBP7032992.1 5'/3'-nucleotidase SurE [Syntrophobacterales bacterium]MDI9555548.1 5'/3'-nucleotidase SurE [Pseudomonadota bacterium]NLX32055.1 5'/3'-nucleotidase SurE [Deltaproteobacteria bacterium]HNU85005.1 5'/3'-nucleotidase SurE [Syntrophales bacterium]